MIGKKRLKMRIRTIAFFIVLIAIQSCRIQKRIEIISLAMLPEPSLGSLLDSFLTNGELIFVNKVNYNFSNKVPPNMSIEEEILSVKKYEVILSRKQKKNKSYCDSAHYEFRKGFLYSINLFSSEIQLLDFFTKIGYDYNNLPNIVDQSNNIEYRNFNINIVKRELHYEIEIRSVRNSKVLKIEQ